MGNCACNGEENVTYKSNLIINIAAASTLKARPYYYVAR